MRGPMKMPEFLTYHDDLLECSRCGRKDTTVKLQSDPYASEIDQDYTEYNLCKKCVHELAQEI